MSGNHLSNSRFSLGVASSDFANAASGVGITTLDEAVHEDCDREYGDQYPENRCSEKFRSRMEGSGFRDYSTPEYERHDQDCGHDEALVVDL